MDRSVTTLLMELQPDVDQAFLDANREVLLEALVERPGIDSVRAVVLRDLDRLSLEEDQRGEVLQKVAESLRAYPDAVASGDPLQLMARHPSWVGLCHLELVDRLGGDQDAALDVALQHARLGFSAAAKGPVQDGETLWALAETAEEVGWEDRMTDLLRRALNTSFAEPTSADQVRLLLGTHLASSEPGEAKGVLEPVVDGDSPHPIRIQAAFVLARLSEAGDAIGAAVAWLDRALALANEAGDTEVARTLDAERARLAIA